MAKIFWRNRFYIDVNIMSIGENPGIGTEQVVLAGI